MDDEKPMDLRDKLAIEIFNGVLSHSQKDTSYLIPDIIYYINYDGYGPEADRLQDAATERIENMVRACYKVADIMRKVRLSAFE